MLRGKGDYRIERWSVGGTPLACVRPPGARAPLPVAIVYHRFSGRNTDDLLRLALPLADSGVATVLPEAAFHGERAPREFDERLAGDRDGLFTDVLDATVREVEDVLAWVAGREDLDASRIGVVGTSLGGAVALMPTTPGPGSSVRQEAAYSPEPERCFPTALMIVHGTEDPTTPYPNARSFYDDLVPHYSDAPERLRFVDMPGEDHRVGAYWIEETLSWLGGFL